MREIAKEMNWGAGGTRSHLPPTFASTVSGKAKKRPVEDFQPTAEDFARLARLMSIGR
jgi:hypothetical protein